MQTRHYGSRLPTYNKALFNRYGVIPVTDATNEQGAKDLADWITSPEGQGVTETYGVEK